MQDPPPFFIVGCPRSGTTLLRRMLDAHPEIGVAPETHFARRLNEIRASDPSGSDRETGRRLSDQICERPEVKEMGLDPDALRKRMLKANPNFGGDVRHHVAILPPGATDEMDRREHP